jgi:hypothetical protein
MTECKYVMISTAAGAVHAAALSSPETGTALDAGKKGSLVDAINKMAEYGYRLLDGTTLVTDCAMGGANVTVFMYRED